MLWPWVWQVAVGLLVLGGLILPGVLFVTTRGAWSPLRAAAGFSRALALAFGTSSSSAALPVNIWPAHCVPAIPCSPGLHPVVWNEMF